MTRKFVSFNALFSFLILLLSSIVLYVIPGKTGSGPWSFTGLNRGQWTDLHITSGILMCLFCVWHILLNRKPLIAGLKKLASGAYKASWPLAAALLLNIFLIIGTIYQVAPMHQMLSFYSETKKEFRQKGNKSSFTPQRAAAEEHAKIGQGGE